MGGSYDNTGSGAGAGKRPTPTIEGTATEVSAEPDANETDLSKESDAKDEPVETGGALPPKDGDGDEDGGAGEGEQPSAAEVTAQR